MPTVPLIDASAQICGGVGFRSSADPRVAARHVKRQASKAVALYPGVFKVVRRFSREPAVVKYYSTAHVQRIPLEGIDGRSRSFGERYSLARCGGVAFGYGGGASGVLESYRGAETVPGRAVVRGRGRSGDRHGR